MKKAKILYHFLLVFFLSGCLHQPAIIEINDTQDVNLECVCIPNSEDQICFIKTDSSIGAYDDVVFYHRNQYGSMTFLKSSTGGVSTFGGITLSEGGGYLYEVWAEEGHPSYTFASTKEFVFGEPDNKQLKITHLEDYYLDHVESFTDDGTFVYATFSDGEPICSDYEKSSDSTDKRCLIYLNIFGEAIHKLEQPHICQ